MKTFSIGDKVKMRGNKKFEVLDVFENNMDTYLKVKDEKGQVCTFPAENFEHDVPIS